jgi:hypothetical protein
MRISWRGTRDGQNKEEERNGQSRGQQAEVEKTDTSHGFGRIFGTSEGRYVPVRNLAGIPKKRIGLRPICRGAGKSHGALVAVTAARGENHVHQLRLG